MRHICNDRVPKYDYCDGITDDVNVDLISMMPEEVLSNLSIRTLAMTTKLSARVKILGALAEDAGEEVTRMQMFMAAITERLALFEMLINSLANESKSKSK